MNYRHAYHAGNFADCFKHALLMALLDQFERKPAPYFVLDTHAGAGRYDLEAEAAQRTGEAEFGIRRLLRNRSPAVQDYLEVVEQLGLYPGSPDLIRSRLRESDRLACCELQTDDAMSLRRRFRDDPQVEVHHRSGWEALSGLLPPREKRGLVFIDPPFEEKSEFFTLMDRLHLGYRRFSHGMFVVWYPIKQLAAVRSFHANLASSGINDIIAVELHLRETTGADRFNGCGLIVINPPYQFEDRARSVAEAVLAGVGDNETGAGTAVRRLADE
jgi:23S rRNA (adenine2030-N6)-methyltransferase